MFNSLFKSIPENIKIIIASASPLVIVLILFLVVGNFGMGKVRSVRDEITQAETAQNILTQKLTLLQTVSQTLGNAPDIAATALPSSNSALTAISQLKNLGFLNSILLSNVKGGTETKDSSGLSRADITFEITGTRPQIMAFIKSIPGVAPIILVDSVKLNESAGVTRATVGVKTFWSALPTTLPKVGQALTDLTPEEKNILVTLSSLTQPVFLALPPAAGGGKTDPFSI